MQLGVPGTLPVPGSDEEAELYSLGVNINNDPLCLVRVGVVLPHFRPTHTHTVICQQHQLTYAVTAHMGCLQMEGRCTSFPQHYL